MKRLSLISALLVVCTMMWADPISKESAQKIAEEFMTRKATSRGMKRAVRMQAVKPLQWNAQPSEASLYLFNASDGNGFVIVSGDDQTEPVLGYSETGTIDTENMPQNLRFWLQHYADQIAFLQRHNITMAKRAIPNLGASIPVQLDCKWNQSPVYNAQCPMAYIYDDPACTQLHVFHDDEGNTKTDPIQCVTGCAATALAQVLYMWKGEGTVGTTADIPAQTDVIRQDQTREGNVFWLKFSDYAIPAGTGIDWDNILPYYHLLVPSDNGYRYEWVESTPEQQEAIASLMHICGAAMGMGYGVDLGSGSSASSIAGTLAAHTLGFANATACFQEFYSYQEWAQLLYDELSVAKAVYFGGVKSAGGGHAFVVDGYDSEDIFHINWGWGSMSDGYFRLNVLDPDAQGAGGVFSDGGYSNIQVFSRGIYPNAPAEAPDVHVMDFYTKSMMPIYYEGEYYLMNTYLKTINARHAYLKADLGLTIEGQGDKRTTSLGAFEMALASAVKEEAMTVSLGALADGEYLCYPSFRVSESDEWTACNGYESHCVKLTVTDGMAYAENIKPCQLANVSIDNKPVYAIDEPINFSAKVQLLKGELHHILGSVCHPIDDWGNISQSSTQLCGVNTYYVAEGETFDVPFSVPSGLPEGAYLFSIVTLGADGESGAYEHTVCMIEVRDGVTSIHSVPTPSDDKTVPVYNLHGQRTDGSYRGITIRNGKKFISK